MSSVCIHPTVDLQPDLRVVLCLFHRKKRLFQASLNFIDKLHFVVVIVDKQCVCTLRVISLAVVEWLCRSLAGLWVCVKLSTCAGEGGGGRREEGGGRGRK